MSKLFIIGNGFDVAHGYKTKYCYFRYWCKEKLKDAGWSLDEVPNIPFSSIANHGEEIFDERDLIKLLMWLLSTESTFRDDPEWNQFEEYLHDIDLQSVMDENTQFVYADLENDPHDNELSNEQQDMEMYADALRSAILQINAIFSRWVEQIRITDKKISFGEEIICNAGCGVDKTDLFLNFNYTETLEKAYGVPKNQICHIHGSRTAGDNLIIGHGDDSGRNFNDRFFTVADILDDAIRSLRKDTNTIINKNKDFWKKISNANITEVYSFGFGYGDVDMDYISTIIRVIPESATWYLNTYSGVENLGYEKKIRSAGFKGCFGRYE